MKDSTTSSAPTPTTATATSPTTNKEKTSTFRDTRAELAQLLKKKEEIEKSLSDIEEQIYAFETSYLKQTQDTGNCIRGWSNCLNVGSGNNTDKSSKFRESDRLFSYSSATSYTLLGRDRLKREREKERRKNIRKHREIMQELSANKKASNVSENNTQSTQPLNEDLDEEIDDEDESTTSSEKPTSRSMTNTSTASKRRAKTKRLRNKRSLSDSSQQSESRD